MSSRWKSTLRWSKPTNGGRTPAKAGPTDDAGDESTPRHGEWTARSALVTRATFAVLVSSVAAGPIALILVVLLVVGGSSQAVTQAPQAIDRSGEQAAATSFAVRFVVAWLQTKAGSEDQLARYVDVSNLQSPNVAFDVSSPLIAGVDRVSPGVWSVTVSADVAPQTAPRKWALRYYQVPVLSASGALIAEALPALVAAPASATTPTSGYGNPVSSDSAVATTAGQFLTAMLVAGGADVSRYESPGTTVPRVSPAPFASVQVSSVNSDQDLSGLTGAPPAGMQVHIFVTALGAGVVNQSVTVQYALTLRARAGRWEIKSMDPAPLVIPPVTSPTPGATPSNR